MTINEKFVTDEYHEGQNAYRVGRALTSNPYLSANNDGRLWYWMFGWQDAMADDVRNIKETIMSVVAPKNRSLN